MHVDIHQFITVIVVFLLPLLSNALIDSQFEQSCLTNYLRGGHRDGIYTLLYGERSRGNVRCVMPRHPLRSDSQVGTMVEGALSHDGKVIRHTTRAFSVRYQLSTSHVRRLQETERCSQTLVMSCQGAHEVSRDRTLFDVQLADGTNVEVKAGVACGNGSLPVRGAVVNILPRMDDRQTFSVTLRLSAVKCTRSIIQDASCAAHTLRSMQDTVEVDVGAFLDNNYPTRQSAYSISFSMRTTDANIRSFAQLELRGTPRKIIKFDLSKGHLLQIRAPGQSQSVTAMYRQYISDGHWHSIKLLVDSEALRLQMPGEPPFTIYQLISEGVSKLRFTTEKDLQDNTPLVTKPNVHPSFCRAPKLDMTDVRINDISVCSISVAGVPIVRSDARQASNMCPSPAVCADCTIGSTLAAGGACAPITETSSSQQATFYGTQSNGGFGIVEYNEGTQNPFKDDVYVTFRTHKASGLLLRAQRGDQVVQLWFEQSHRLTVLTCSDIMAGNCSQCVTTADQALDDMSWHTASILFDNEGTLFAGVDGRLCRPEAIHRLNSTAVKGHMGPRGFVYIGGAPITEAYTENRWHLNKLAAYDHQFVGCLHAVYIGGQRVDMDAAIGRAKEKLVDPTELRARPGCTTCGSCSTSTCLPSWRTGATSIDRCDCAADVLVMHRDTRQCVRPANHSIAISTTIVGDEWTRIVIEERALLSIRGDKLRRVTFAFLMPFSQRRIFGDVSLLRLTTTTGRQALDVTCSCKQQRCTVDIDGHKVVFNDWTPFDRRQHIVQVLLDDEGHTTITMDDNRQRISNDELSALPAVLSGVELGRVYVDDNETSAGCVSELWMETRRNGQSRFTDLLGGHVEKGETVGECGRRDENVLRKPRATNFGRLGEFLDLEQIPRPVPPSALDSLDDWSTLVFACIALASVITIVVLLVGVCCVCRKRRQHLKHTHNMYPEVSRSTESLHHIPPITSPLALGSPRTTRHINMDDPLDRNRPSIRWQPTVDTNHGVSV